MKAQKTNTIQLIIAGVVVILVAICGTFAWFAVSDSSRVNHIGASVASPSMESGFGEIQIYDPMLKDWVEYDGKDPLSFIPGQSYSFRVTFYSGDAQQIWLDLKDIKDSGGDERYQLYNALTYRVKTQEDDESGSPSSLKVESDNIDGKLYARLIDGRTASEFNQEKDLKRVIYYDLILPGTAGNEYFDKAFSALVELIIS